MTDIHQIATVYADGVYTIYLDGRHALQWNHPKDPAAMVKDPLIVASAGDAPNPPEDQMPDETFDETTALYEKIRTVLPGLPAHDVTSRLEIVLDARVRQPSIKAELRADPPQGDYTTKVERYDVELSPRSQRGMGWALGALRAGKKVARKGWNGKDQHLELQVPDEHSKMTLPYIFIVTVQGDRVPWLASQTDLLATDWVLAPDPTDPTRGEGRTTETP